MYVEVFAKFMLNINWLPGKSEAMLKYRGHGTRAAHLARIVEGALCIKLPTSATAAFLHVVTRYKHLGSVVSMDGNDCHDAKLRASSAMSAYCPLASKIFGSPKVGLWLKLLFMHALVLSRLLYQVYLWDDKPKPFRILNNVYMRVLRRIANMCRFDSECKYTDLHVREQLMQPSMDCLVSRARLLYASRVNKSRTPILRAILAQHTHTRPMPWVVMLLRDFKYMFNSPACCDVLSQIEGSPSTIPDPACSCCVPCKCKATWLYFTTHRIWPQAVQMLFWMSSRHDLSVGPNPSPSPSDGVQHVCTICQAKESSHKHVFDTAKALSSNCRVKHAVRNDMRRYVGTSKCCSVCETTFGSRLSLIQHLSDSRRPKCRDVLLATASPISDELCTQLDELDKVARRTAQQKGYSHASVSVPAQRVALCEA